MRILAGRAFFDDLGGSVLGKGNFLSPVVFKRQGSVGPGDHPGADYSPLSFGLGFFPAVSNFGLGSSYDNSEMLIERDSLYI